MRAALPAGAFLRDFAYLEAANGYLVLYGLNAEPGVFSMQWHPVAATWQPDFGCFPYDYGQVVSAVYGVALVRSGKMVNEIRVPFSFDGNDTYLMYRQFKGVLARDAKWEPHEAAISRGEAQEELEKIRASIEPGSSDGMDYLSEADMEVVEPPLIVLQDYTGDGEAHEFRFRYDYISCGNNLYAFFGYDRETDRVWHYRFENELGTHDGLKNFYPQPGGRTRHDTGLDHGAQSYYIRTYEFNPKRHLFNAIESSGSLPR